MRSSCIFKHCKSRTKSRTNKTKSQKSDVFMLFFMFFMNNQPKIQQKRNKFGRKKVAMLTHRHLKELTYQKHLS